MIFSTDSYLQVRAAFRTDLALGCFGQSEHIYDNYYNFLLAYASYCVIGPAARIGEASKSTGAMISTIL
jgi:hypothetical protein